MPKNEKAEKIAHLLEKIRVCLQTGNYKFTKHALERSEQRYIQLPDVLEVLLPDIMRR